MKHPERAITLWTPFANADGKTSGVEQIQDLFRADDVRVIAQIERAFPFAELTAISDVRNAHADLHHVFTRIGLPVDLDHITVNVKGSASFHLRDVGNVRTRVHRRRLKSHSREAESTIRMFIER